MITIAIRVDYQTDTSSKRSHWRRCQVSSLRLPVKLRRLSVTVSVHARMCRTSSLRPPLQCQSNCFDYP